MSKKKSQFDLSELPKDKDTQSLCEFVGNALDDMKAMNIVFINVKDISSVTDVMVIASGTSNRHVKSVAESLIEECKKNDIEILGSEGQDASEWVLVDLGFVLVHVMQEQTRGFYELEKLWSHRQEGSANETEALEID
jgi:ribosome-associated protein